MEQNYNQEEKSQTSSTFVLPPHNNLMIWSILATLFCCLVGGIVAIVYSANSNSAYRNAMITTDPALKQSLYNESEAENKKAKTWLWVSIGVALVGWIVYAIFFATVGLAAFSQFM